MKEKRGRPRKEDGRTMQIKTRLTEEEYENLVWLAEETDRSMSDVIREALRIYGNMKKYMD